MKVNKCKRKQTVKKPKPKKVYTQHEWDVLLRDAKGVWEEHQLNMTIEKANTTYAHERAEAWIYVSIVSWVISLVVIGLLVWVLRGS